jgi:hypothetical protein
MVATHKVDKILQHVDKFGILERKMKKVWIAVIFTLLSDGGPMTQYESFLPLFSILDVLQLPHVYWVDTFAWIMAELMYDLIEDEIRTLVSFVHYIAVICNEMAIDDNGHWMSGLAYICYN